jgi:hypothetical protein
MVTSLVDKFKTFFSWFPEFQINSSALMPAGDFSWWFLLSVFFMLMAFGAVVSAWAFGGLWSGGATGVSFVEATGFVMRWAFAMSWFFAVGEKAREWPRMFCCGQKEVGWRDGDALTTAAKVPMGHDKFRGKPIAAEITGALSMIHTDGEILVHLKVQMGRIHSVVVTYRPDLLPTHDLLALANKDPIEMSWKWVCEVKLPILDPSMTNDYDIAPADTNIAGQNNDSVADGINGVTKPFGTPTISHPIFAQMSTGTETSGFVIPMRIWRSHGEIKAICWMRRRVWGRGGYGSCGINWHCRNARWENQQGGNDRND